MPLIPCTNVFHQGRLSRHITLPPRRFAPSLGVGTTRVRQHRSGSCHHHTSDTKRNEQPSQATAKPSLEEKHAHPPRVVWCAIYSTLTRFAKFRVSDLHTTSTRDATNTLLQRISPRAAIPLLHIREDLPRLRSGSCHHHTSDTKCNEQPSQAIAKPS